MIEYDGEDVMPGVKLSSNANIFELMFEEFTEYSNGDKLPGIWVTDAVYDPDGRYLGHTYAWPYVPNDDPTGDDALYYGSELYDDGMRVSDPEFAEARQDCFKAAELLFRHAAGKGNAIGNLCLGYVYYYDRCGGAYWKNPDTLETGADYRRPFPRSKRAFECFKAASEAGIEEGSYKLGDCYKTGNGCDIDEKKAFESYMLAKDQSEGAAPYLLGGIALRLAGCLEEGIGVEHDFGRALVQYKRAEELLDAAVRSGDWFYKKSLAGARDGIKRCRQELALG